MQLLSNALESLSLLVVFLTPVMILHCFYDDRIYITLKKLGVIFGAGLSMLVISHLLKDLPDDYGILPAVFLIMPIITVLWGLKMRPLEYIKLGGALILTAIICLLYSMQLVMITAFIAGQRNIYDNEYAALIVIAVGIDLIISILMYLLLVRKDISMLFRRSDKLMAVIFVFWVFISTGLFDEIDQKKNPTDSDTLICLLMLILLILTPIMIFKNRQSSYYSELSSKNEVYLEAELAASRQYREAQEETRAFRHDIKNQLDLLAQIVHKGDLQKAEEYLTDLRGGLAALSPRVVTGDDMLDSLISVKLGDLEKAGIKVDINGVIDGGLDWKPQDICAVFANAVDNAAEACKKLNEDADKHISLSFRKTKMQRIIKISNSAAQKVDCEKLMSDTAHYTSKEDKTLHGFGMRNIHRTIEKYGGIMELSSTDSEFTMTIVLTK